MRKSGALLWRLARCTAPEPGCVRYPAFCRSPASKARALALIKLSWNSVPMQSFLSQKALLEHLSFTRFLRPGLGTP